MFEDDAGAKSYNCVVFTFDGQVKLSFLRFSSRFKNGDIGSLLIAFVLDHGFVQLIIYLEVACG